MADNETRDTDKQQAERTKHYQRLSQLIKALWAALLKPNWTYDELVSLGKAIFAKQRIESLDQKIFDRLLPHFQLIGTELLKHFDLEHAEDVKSSPETPKTESRDAD